MRAALLTVVLLLVAPVASADAAVVGRDGRPAQPYQRWAAQLRVPEPEVTVRFHGERCPGAEVAACAIWPDTVYFYPAWITGRGYFYHELGHIYDYGMPQWVRDRFARIMRYGIGGPDGWVQSGANERFAEAYALCGLGGRAARAYDDDGYGYRPSRRQNRAVCRLLRGL